MDHTLIIYFYAHLRLVDCSFLYRHSLNSSFQTIFFASIHALAVRLISWIVTHILMQRIIVVSNITVIFLVISTVVFLVTFSFTVILISVCLVWQCFGFASQHFFKQQVYLFVQGHLVPYKPLEKYRRNTWYFSHVRLKDIARSSWRKLLVVPAIHATELEWWWVTSLKTLRTKKVLSSGWPRNTILNCLQILM